MKYINKDESRNFINIPGLPPICGCFGTKCRKDSI
jgi:hypothetical protein